MRLTWAAHGLEVSITTDHDDVDLNEAIEMVQALLTAAGFSSKTVGKLMIVDTEDNEDPLEAA